MLTKKESSTLIGISLMTFIVFLDVTIVSSALPAIQHEFVASLNELQWILNALFLTLSALMATIGRVGDLLGRRRVLRIASFIFLVASIGAGCAPTIEWLIFFRFLQGIAGASIPVAAALLSNHFSPERQPHILGLFATINGSGLALGPLIGGLLVETLSWRWIFLINIPVILISLALCAYSVQEQKTQDPDEKIDIPAALAMIIGISALMAALSEAPDWGWSNSWTMALFGLAVISLAIFYSINHRSQHPIIDFDVFQNRHVIVAGLCSFLMGGIIGVLLLLDPIYLQSIRGETAEYAGLIMLAISGTFIVMSPVMGKFVHRFGIKAGLYVMLILCVVTSFLHQQFSLTSPIGLIILAFVTFGLPWSLGNVAPTLAVVSAVDSKHAAVTLGSIWTIWNLGSCSILAIGGFLLRHKAETAIATTLEEQGGAISLEQLSAVGHLVLDPVNAAHLLRRFSHLTDTTVILKNAFMQGFEFTLQFLVVMSVAITAAAYCVLRKAKEIQVSDESLEKFG